MLGCSAQRIAITSHILNAASIMCLLASLLTNQWLLTEERIRQVAVGPRNSSLGNLDANRRINITYAIRRTESGLWTFCQQDRK